MKFLIAANWKCNPASFLEAKSILGGIKNSLGAIKKSEIVICPPFIFLSSLKLLNFGVKFGAQDCFWQKNGAFTGEISPSMLKSVKVDYIIVGHSERRRYFFETDETINKKIKEIIRVGLHPIFCVGETSVERKKGLLNKVLQNQIIKGLGDVKNPKNLSIAYEPVWAIGTGKSCFPQDAKKAADFIRKVLKKKYNKKTAQKIRIIYGGSVNSKNAGSYLKESGMQGLLVGGASLNSAEFTNIIKICEK